LPERQSRTSDLDPIEAADLSSETVMLPADHPDAIAHLKKGSTSESAESTTIDEAVKPQESEGATVADAGPSKPKSKPPPRRKPRQSLEAMSAALDKGKKMTTLEKVSHSPSDILYADLYPVTNGLEETHGRRPGHRG
jgi:hypothetical protein